MDPITLIVTAVALGAAAGLKPTAEQAVKDAYAGIKVLIQRKYAGVGVEAVEKKPESKAKQASLAEDLQDAGADNDPELIEQANAVVEAVEQSKLADATAAAIGVNLKEIKAEYLRIQKVIASGTGVQVEGGEFTGGIDISDVQAGAHGATDPKA